MQIGIRTIPHDTQRYPTTGDWEFQRTGTRAPRVIALHISVSEMGDERFEEAIGIHELIEALLCKHQGIDEDEVNDFDRCYELAREGLTGNPTRETALAGQRLKKFYGCGCKITAESEPGDDAHAPYYHQHQLATSVERMYLAEVGASWNEYEKANLNLYAAEQTGANGPGHPS